MATSLDELRALRRRVLDAELSMDVGWHEVTASGVRCEAFEVGA